MIPLLLFFFINIHTRRVKKKHEKLHHLKMFYKIKRIDSLDEGSKRRVSFREKNLFSFTCDVREFKKFQHSTAWTDDSSSNRNVKSLKILKRFHSFFNFTVELKINYVVDEIASISYLNRFIYNFFFYFEKTVL